MGAHGGGGGKAIVKASAIVPAYNEADRIRAVLTPLQRAKSVDEIIVVDDGSCDQTGEVARRLGVRVIRLPRNLGKALALDEGVREASHEVLIFLDADLVGLKPEHVDFLISRYRERDLDMVVGTFRSGRINTDLAQSIAPYLSGQRVLSRRLWARVKELAKLEYGVEMALTKLALKEGWAEERVYLEGVTHVMKEEKRGFSRGLRERLSMYGSIVRSFFSRVG